MQRPSVALYFDASNRRQESLFPCDWRNYPRNNRVITTLNKEMLTCEGKGLMCSSREVKTLSTKARRNAAHGGTLSFGLISSIKYFPRI